MGILDDFDSWEKGKETKSSFSRDVDTISAEIEREREEAKPSIEEQLSLKEMEQTVQKNIPEENQQGFWSKFFGKVPEKTQVDPALEEQLKRRGMEEKLAELETAEQDIITRDKEEQARRAEDLGFSPSTDTLPESRIDPALRRQLEERGETEKIRELEMAEPEIRRQQGIERREAIGKGIRSVADVVEDLPTIGPFSDMIKSISRTLSPGEESFTQEDILNVEKQVPKFAFDAAIGAPAKFITSLGIDLTSDTFELITGRSAGEREFIPSSKITKMLLGEEGIPSFSLKLSRARDKSEELGGRYGLSAGEQDLLNGTFMMAPIMMGVLDVLPIAGRGAGAVDDVAKAVAKTGKIDDIILALKTVLKGSDESVEVIAKTLVDKTNTKQIKTILDDLIKIAAKGDEAVKVKALVKGAEELAPKVDEITGAVPKAVKEVAEEIPEASKVFKQAAPKAEEIIKKTESLTPKGVVKNIDNSLPEANSLALAKERGFITSAKETFPELKVAGQYIPRSTDDLAIKAKNLIKSDIAAAEKLALEGADDKAVATASELIKHYGDLAQKSKGARQEALYDKAAEITENMARKLTEQGRSIQAASILGRQTPEGMLRFAARTIQKHNKALEAGALGERTRGLLGIRKKLPGITAEQAKDILTKTKAMQDLPDGVEKAIAFQKIMDDVNGLIPSTWYQKVTTIWKAGLLTGLKTTGLNTISNLSHGISETIKDIPTVAVDKVASIFTGKRTAGLTLKGKGGIREGFEKGARYFTTGYDERAVGVKLDYLRTNFGKSKFAKTLQTYEETIFKSLGAQDQPFYYGAKARSLRSQAIAQGKNEGLKGGAIKKFIEKLVENPTDDMIRIATNDAEMAIFTNRTLLGDVAKGIQKLPGGEIVVPFGRTPAAVATQIINYSPVGVVKTIVENIGKGRFDQRLFAQGLGRGMTGTGVMFIGIELMKKDLISLDYPETDRERQQWELEGKKENSIKIGNKWRSVSTLGPLGHLLLFGGHYKEAVDETGSFSSALPLAAASSAKSFLEQTFLVGVNQFSNALNNPDRYAEALAGNLIGSIVPTIASDIARTLDPFERETSPKREGLTAPLKSRIPKLRETLEPRVDVLGHPVERMGNAVETMLDPTRPSRIKSNDVIVELRRLLDAGVSITPTTFGDDKKTLAVLDPDQRTYMKEKAGQILELKLEKLFVNAEYKKLDNEEQKKVIQKFTNKARVIAKVEMVEQIISGLPDEEKRAKLSELKQSGFMTQEVFKVWQESF